jgi:hypothetical protein
LVLLADSSVVGLARRGTSSRGFFATGTGISPSPSIGIGDARVSSATRNKGKLRLATLRRNLPLMVRPVVALGVEVVAVALQLSGSVRIDASYAGIDASTARPSIV